MKTIMTILLLALLTRLSAAEEALSFIPQQYCGAYVTVAYATGEGEMPTIDAQLLQPVDGPTAIRIAPTFSDIGGNRYEVDRIERLGSGALLITFFGTNEVIFLGYSAHIHGHPMIYGVLQGGTWLVVQLEEVR